MSLRKPRLRMTVSEYLEMEKTSEVKHEYLDGEIYAMAGASKGTIWSAIIWFEILMHYAEGRAQIFAFEVKVYIETLNTFYYPDLVVACDPDDNDDYFVRRPVLVVEVESPTTSITDKREKLMAYRKLPSLREYLILSRQHPSRVASQEGRRRMVVLPDLAGR